MPPTCSGAKKTQVIGGRLEYQISRSLRQDEPEVGDTKIQGKDVPRWAAGELPQTGQGLKNGPSQKGGKENLSRTLSEDSQHATPGAELGHLRQKASHISSDTV